MKTNTFLSILLLAAPCSFTAAGDLGSPLSFLQRLIPLPEIEIPPTSTAGSSSSFSVVSNGTCSKYSSNETYYFYSNSTESLFRSNIVDNNDKSPIQLLVDIQDKQVRLQYIKAMGIEVEHRFLNEASDRFLYIENFHSTHPLLVGEVGAAEAYSRENLLYQKENSFLTFREMECPSDNETKITIGQGPCFTIENGNGQLYAMPFRENPILVAFQDFQNYRHTDSWEDGITVFDSTRFERVYDKGLWMLEDRTPYFSSKSVVSIRNVGTGRRLFAKYGHDKQDKFGGTPGTDDIPVQDDQLWRHCVRYTLGDERRIDCSRYI